MRQQPLGVVRGYACESLESRLLLTTNTAAVELLHTTPAVFVQNVGQWADASVKFVHQGEGASIAMTNRGPVFDLFRDVTPAPDARNRLKDARVELSHTESQIERTRFSVDFLNANVVSPVGQDPSSSTFNYFIGDASTHRSNVQGFERVVYPSLWSGIDLHSWGQRDSLKYEFHIAPGSDYRQIALRYDGIDQLWIDKKGRLNAELNNGFGTVRDDKPVIYQEVNGRRVAVAGRFELLDEQSYTFELTGRHDPNLPLIIDPDLAWGAFVGGSDDDSIDDIAVDAAGNVWATGLTYSGDLPGGGFDSNYNGDWDAYVVKLDASGTVAWGSYLGGSHWDSPRAIAIDGSGNAWVTGLTFSEDFPHGGFDSKMSGDYDAFLAKIASNGTLRWGSYLGGSAIEEGMGVAIDSRGNAIVIGWTWSTDFPTRGGFDRTYEGGPDDSFITKINASGNLAWSSYLGGSEDDCSFDIAIDQADNAWVSGRTSSDGFLKGGFDPTHNGNTDVLVAKVSSGGALHWGSYLGGSSNDYGYSIALDKQGNAWITGPTTSTDFPIVGGFDASYNGGYCDALVTKVSASGSLAWTSYLGGSGDDYSRDIAVDSAGNVWLAGDTSSSISFSSSGTTFHGWEDAFLAKINAGGSLAWDTFLGGPGQDSGSSVCIDRDGNIWMAGGTSGGTFDDQDFNSGPYHGMWDGYIARFVDVPVAGIGGAWSGVRGQPLTFFPGVQNVDAEDIAAGFTYSLDFGDGTKHTFPRKPNNSYGVSISHTYKKPGVYTLSLTAVDHHGRSSAVTHRDVTISSILWLTDSGLPRRDSLFIGGTPGSDTIAFEKTPAGKARLVLNGVVQGEYRVSNRILVFAQGGDDLISMAPGLTTNVVFYGGEGRDTLYGGSGNDALFGNAGNDVISGHSGMDILVGSSGKDLLRGEGSGDILVGGGTDIDTGTYLQLSRVRELLNTWTSRNSYADRVATISRHATRHAVLNPTNVHDDAAVDILTGGTGLDWFFASVQGSTKDSIYSEAGEVITAIV